MKAACILTVLLFLHTCLYAQHKIRTDTVVPAKGNVNEQVERINEKKIELHSDSLGNQPLKSSRIDSTLQNRYGDLLNDDPMYNKKAPFWRGAIEIVGADVFAWSLDRLIYNKPTARISIASWKINLTQGWEWDNKRFGKNFLGQPYTGALAFNAGRAGGYNFYQSIPYAVAGSLLWEYLGENTRPAYNDIINTPVSGAFFGEILYRLSSNILDDRTRGANRVFREIAAAVIDPKRGFSRLVSGKSYRRTTKEVYQKEPINISFYAGARRLVNENENYFGTGTHSAMINAQLDYGNPFEVRSRKPFDFFKIRADVNFGVGRKIIDNVLGYGILFGKNIQLGKMALLVGGFQYYDYWNSNIFELGTIGFGGGVLSKLALSKSSNLYTRIHLAIVPFAGSSMLFDPDTSLVKVYNYGGGLEGKLETTVNLNKYATASMIYYFYWVSTYVGTKGNNIVHIVKPRITVRLFKMLSIGFETDIYYNDRFLRDYKAIHLVRTEQKIFLLLYFEDRQRRGQYN
jgi:hypothetical protein